MREDAHYPPQDGKTPWSFTAPWRCCPARSAERRWEASAANGTPPWPCWVANPRRDPARRQCQAGSLTGAVASQKVTEASKAALRLVGNQLSSTKAQGRFTARRTCRAVAKAGHSDPLVAYGCAKDHRIEATLGITGLSCPSAHSDGKVWHLDVGSSHPGAGFGPKG